MKIFTGQKINGWWKVYGLWTGKVFIGVSITPTNPSKDL